MWGVGHGFRATCYYHVCVTRLDGLCAEDYGFERGGADFVYCGCDDGLGEAGAEGALAGGILAEAEGGLDGSILREEEMEYLADKTLPK